MIKRNDAPATLADLKAGDEVEARGTLDGTTLTASRVLVEAAEMETETETTTGSGTPAAGTPTSTSTAITSATATATRTPTP